MMLHYGKHHLEEDDIQAVVEVLRSGALTQGPMVERFERAVADYVGARFAVAVASGTAALHLTAMAANLGPGSALCTSPITFVASANAALYVGARAVFADVEAATVNMAPAALEATLAENPDVRLVIPVHFAGLPCDMPAIRDVANRHGAMVVEDAAHALSASLPDDSRVGACRHSDMTIFSFHPVKAIAAGEGGMITTNDEGLYRRLLRLRSHGINKLDDAPMLPEEAFSNGTPNPWYYEMRELGYHYRITDIQCALALSQFGKLDRFVGRRRELVKRYDAAFAGFSHLRPAQTTGRDLSGHHLYVVRIDFEALGRDRGEVMRALREREVGSQVHYIPVPGHPHYRRLDHDPARYPHAQAYYQEALSIPLFYSLTDAQQDHVVATLRELVG